MADFIRRRRDPNTKRFTFLTKPSQRQQWRENLRKAVAEEQERYQQQQREWEPRAENNLAEFAKAHPEFSAEAERIKQLPPMLDLEEIERAVWGESRVPARRPVTVKKRASFAIKSEHPLKPPKDEIEARLFWHYACLRRNKGYHELRAQYEAEKVQPDDLDWHCKTTNAGLAEMVNPELEENAFINYVRKTGGAWAWLKVVGGIMRQDGSPSQMLYSIGKGIWHEPNPDYSKTKSGKWGTKGAELNQEGGEWVEIQKAEWEVFQHHRFDLMILDDLDDPKRRAEMRKRVEAMTNDDLRETALRLFDDPAFAQRRRQEAADWLEGHAVMDFKVRTDWPIRTILAHVARVIGDVKKCRAMAKLPDTGFTKQAKALGEGLRIWDALPDKAKPDFSELVWQFHGERLRALKPFRPQRPEDWNTGNHRGEVWKQYQEALKGGMTQRAAALKPQIRKAARVVSQYKQAVKAHKKKQAVYERELKRLTQSVKENYELASTRIAEAFQP